MHSTRVLINNSYSMTLPRPTIIGQSFIEQTDVFISVKKPVIGEHVSLCEMGKRCKYSLSQGRVQAGALLQRGGIQVVRSAMEFDVLCRITMCRPPPVQRRRHCPDLFPFCIRLPFNWKADRSHFTQFRYIEQLTFLVEGLPLV